MIAPNIVNAFLIACHDNKAAAGQRAPRGTNRRTSVVRFENVGLRYSLGPEVLRDVSFQLAPQSFQFLTGPSGAGKSSLLRMLFLALKPNRGVINLLGPAVARLWAEA